MRTKIDRILGDTVYGRCTLESLILGSILFTIYVGIFVKGILFRLNDDGNLVFAPKNLFNLMVYPLKSTTFWRPEMWKLNFFIYVFISAFVVYLARYKLESPTEQIDS
jgi:hypothetical protein